MSFDLKLNNGDLSIGKNSTLDRVFNDDKLRQDLVKVILTPIGTNKLFPWYGSPITQRSLGKVFDLKIINMETTNALIYSINNLMSLQKDQSKSGQYVSPSESIAQIINIAAEASAFDARQINITVSVASRKANVVEESFKLRV